MTLWIYFFLFLSTGSVTIIGIQLQWPLAHRHTTRAATAHWDLTQTCSGRRMCVIFYWLEREILLFKLLIFILNWINIRTHPARAQYIILSNADTKMNMSPALKKRVIRRLINHNSLEKLAKAKFHAFCLFLFQS